jgi:hypothetical protein
MRVCVCVCVLVGKKKKKKKKKKENKRKIQKHTVHTHTSLRAQHGAFFCLGIHINVLLFLFRLSFPPFSFLVSKTHVYTQRNRHTNRGLNKEVERNIDTVCEIGE